MSFSLPASNNLSDLLTATHACRHSFEMVQQHLLPHFTAFLKKDPQMGEVMMGSLLMGSGNTMGDPLMNMGFGVGGETEASTMTLGALYFLSARLFQSQPPPTMFTTIASFCKAFDPKQARLAPERVTLLARGIKKWAEMNGNGNATAAVGPLRDLVVRYPPSLAYLTTIHPIFLETCCMTNNFVHALPVLQVPITEVDKYLSDLHYTDNLVYHYTGGVALAALKRFREAAEFFEIVMSSPCSVPSAVQMEAYKKLTLIQLILYGKTSSAPKYTPPVVSRLFKSSASTAPYLKLISAFESGNRELVRNLIHETEALRHDNNHGLANQAFERLPWIAVKRLKETYMKLSLEEIAKEVGISAKWDDPRGARALVVNMIAANELSATISPDGTVSFEEEAPEGTQISKAQIESALAQAREAVDRLGELDRSMGKSKDYIQKALHARDSGGMGWQEDEPIMSGRGGDWDDM